MVSTWEWGATDDEGVEIEVRSDGSISVLVDANGAVQERVIGGFTDPFLSEALAWAEKLS